jgi:hypothetical protein
LLTREALLYTFIDHLKEYNLKRAINQMENKKKPSFSVMENMDFDGLDLEDYACIKNVCHIISWNFWQMDGLTACPPYINPSKSMKILVAAINNPHSEALFSNESFEIPSEYCKLMDWEENKVTTFVEVYASATKKHTA